ncbi:hypothetical protein PVAND_000676 [Polypedilum vanderplanki]|uniref:Leucine-rich repeat protein n=1 Tax=Polypedilum vanderplanki TaxID=319348 RepID=A0A9J6BL19_POLVA|nr:hypothetical protein PVAND_000676 [Polypedilum vanderplanki]
MKILLFLFLYHFVIIGGEILFKCDKIDSFDDNPFTCAFNSMILLKDFDNYLSNLTNLKFNYIENNVTKESTVDLKDITKILIKNVTFEDSPVNLFLKFPFLKSLTITADISKLNSSDFINATYVEDIDLSNIKISNLQNAQFKNLVNVKSITLAYNNIALIDNNAFSNIGSNLSYIDLSHNQITIFREDFITAMIFNQDSIAINLSFNNLNKFVPADSKFPNNSTDITLNLSFNNLTEILMKNRIYGINLNKNQLNEIKVEATNIIAEHNQLDSFTISNDLEVLTLDNNRLFSLKWKENLPNLIEIDLSDNKMFVGELQELFPVMQNLKILDLSDNKIDSLNLTTALINLLNLRHLSIKNIGLNKISENSFKNLTNLESLIMSHNPLMKLNLNYFETLKNLEVLKIDHTSLYTIEEYKKVKEFMPNLIRISIDGNSINCGLLEAIYNFFESNGIEVIDPEKILYDHQNVKGIECVDINQDLSPIINIHDNEEIAYKLEEIMQHVKKLEDKQKQVQEHFGVSMQQMIIGNFLSIAITLLIFFIAISIAKYLRNNRY